MADYFYTLQSCIDQTNIQTWSSTTEYSVGQVIGITGPVSCYTVTEVSNTPLVPDLTGNAIDSYSTCLECIQSNGGSFNFTSCVDPFDDLDINVLSSTIVPQSTQVYNLLTTGGTNGCFTFNDWVSITPPIDGLISIEGGYVDCNQCTVLSLPQSANTEVFVCEYICVTGGTGSSVVVVTPPHPQYSNTQGNSVTQLNMITIGGFNGLNS